MRSEGSQRAFFCMGALYVRSSTLRHFSSLYRLWNHNVYKGLKLKIIKYLISFYFLIIATSAYSALATRYYNSAEGSTVLYDTTAQACIGYFKVAPPLNYKSSNGDAGQGRCGFTRIDGSIGTTTAVLGSTKVEQCKASGWPVPVYLPQGTTRIPIRMCKDGCTIEGNGVSIETNNYIMTPMHFTGNSNNCTEAYKDDPVRCDTTDPYGSCFVPPNDNCVRSSDGSIFCPEEQQPPQNETCNGADYCNRPPEG